MRRLYVSPLDCARGDRWSQHSSYRATAIEGLRCRHRQLTMPPSTACDGGCVSPPPLLPLGKQGYLAKQEYLAIYYWIVCHLLLDTLPFILYVFCREQMLRLSYRKAREPEEHPGFSGFAIGEVQKVTSRGSAPTCRRSDRPNLTFLHGWATDSHGSH